MNKNNRKYYQEHLKKLMPGCIQKDPASWDELIKLISPLIIYITKEKFLRLRFNYQKTDLENIKQEILLSLWQDNKLETIKDNERIIPWICVFSKNAAHNYVRDFKPTDLPNSCILKDSIKSSYRLPSEKVIGDDIKKNINTAISSLNYREKLVIKLSILHNKKHREIAKILDLPLGSVLVCANRARSKLRKKLKKIVIK